MNYKLNISKFIFGSGIVVSTTNFLTPKDEYSLLIWIIGFGLLFFGSVDEKK